MLDNKGVNLNCLIAECEKIHEGKGYEYWFSGFTNTNGNAFYICPKHRNKGPIVQSINNHLYKKNGCPHCSGVHPKTKTDYINEFKEIFGEEYKFNFIEKYKKTNKQDEVSNKPSNQFVEITDKYGRTKCYPANMVKCKKTIIDKWVENLTNAVVNLKMKHSERFQIDLRFAGSPSTKIETIVDTYMKKTIKNVSIMSLIKDYAVYKPQEDDDIEKNNPFLISKFGTKGEAKICDYLKINSIRYIYQQTFSDCRDKKLLRFDFFLYDYNVLIEYDGIQHKKAVKIYGGEIGLKDRIRKDNIKDKYIYDKEGFELFRIKHN